MSIVLALVLAGGAPRPLSVCEQLQRDFDNNELVFGIIRKTNDGVTAAARTFANATGNRTSLLEAQRKSKADDAEFMAKGDRIVTLMAGHRCPLPDHVTRPKSPAP